MLFFVHANQENYLDDNPYTKLCKCTANPVLHDVHHLAQADHTQSRVAP
jgi:hypothetical protein